ncbi:hypothetical protein SAMN06265379_103246 [Saccharicrinis carchari]|uniref:Uncharacterized protein n=1 Tax=Saccharicrinis carchari TaxID=1168039 RepID=A0A521CKS9_SACCC|nr:hypothetical protein SAMN06265379_103246 [Saccharicrinis carchari]
MNILNVLVLGGDSNIYPKYHIKYEIDMPNRLVGIAQ